MNGLKYYRLNCKRTEKTIYIQPIHYMVSILDDIKASVEEINETIELYNNIVNRSSLIKHSNPRSIAFGIVFYYYKILGKSTSEFERVYHLSDTTTNRLFKDINSILGKW